MRVHKLTLATVVLVLVGGAASAWAAVEFVELAAPRAQTATTLDGLASEWEGIPFVYLGDSIRVLSARHDDTNLYLMFRFGDERLARRVRRLGVTFWLDGAARTETRFGVRYGASKALAASLGSSGEPGGAAPDAKNADKALATGFAPAPGTVAIVRPVDTESRPESGEDIAAASMFAEGSYCWELRIPLAMIPGPAKTKGGAARVLSVGVQIGGLSESEQLALKDAAAEGQHKRSGGFNDPSRSAGPRIRGNDNWGNRGRTPGGSSGGFGDNEDIPVPVDSPERSPLTWIRLTFQ